MNERTQLEQLISEPIAAALDREQTESDRLSSPFNSSFVLFGAGGLGQKTLYGLRQAGIEPMAFADNNQSLWKTDLAGLPLLSPKEAASRFSGHAAFVVTIWRAGGGHRFEHTRSQLLDIGCSRVLSFAPLFWKYASIFLPYYAIGLPHELLTQAKEIMDGFALWADDHSRREYLAQVRWRLKADFDGLPTPVLHPQYLPDDLFRVREDEVFVDCGAYDGDSLRSLVQQQPAFKGNIVAVEPDPSNLENLANYIATLPKGEQDRITVMPVALGAQRETVRFKATGTASAGVNLSGLYNVETLPLDDLLNGPAPSFIKMDIEGAELDALMGATHIIKKTVPVLAICVYHKPDHLWRIPLLVRSLSDEYRFFLRAHNEEGWDLVCYAVPTNRLQPGLTVEQGR